MENLRITNGMAENLLSAVKWLKFLTVVAVVALALVLVIGLVTISTGVAQGIAVFVGELFAVAFYAYPIVKSFALIANVRKALGSGDQAAFEESADNVRAIMKYIGILTIIFLSLYVLVLLIAFLAAGSLFF